MEQLVLFFIKIKLILTIQSPSDASQMAIFSFIRIFFRYTDNTPELCSVKILDYEKDCYHVCADGGFDGRLV